MTDILFWLEAVRYRWRAVGVAVIVAVAITLLYLLSVAQVFTASATLFFDSNAPAPLEAENDAKVDNSLETEIEIIRSLAVAEEVVRQLDLRQNDELISKWQSSGLEISFGGWLTQWVNDTLRVTKNSGSRVVTIHAVASEAEFAAELANSYAQASRDKLLSLSPAAASGYLDQLAKEVTEAKESVASAETVLRAFVVKTGITNNGDLGAEAIRNANIAVQTAAAQAQLAGARNLGGIDEYAIEATERSSIIQNIRTQLATRRSELSELSASKGPNHPQIISANAEVAMLEEALTKEREETVAAFATGRAAAIASERASSSATAGTMSFAAARQSVRLRGMSESIGRMTTLQSELAAAQTHYFELKARLGRMELEKSLTEVTVSSLDMATTPLFPSSPKYSIFLLCSVILGLIIGTAIAVILETINPYVRNPLSLQRALGIPVIGRVSLPKRTIRELVDVRNNT